MGEVFLPGNHRYLGNQFMMWRQEAEMSREEVAEAVGYSAEMVRSVEQGRRACPPRMAEIADELFGARGKLKAGLSYLTREKFPARTRDYIWHEAESVSIWSYECVLIPGLLQTEEYAQALIGGRCPAMDEETVAERVAARMERKQLFTRKPPVEFSFVIYEAALRTPMGGAAVHKRQLLQLLEVGSLRNVALQVLPFSRVLSGALSGSLVILETRDHVRMSLAEGQQVSLLTSDSNEVHVMTESYAKFRMEAFNAEESAQFIQRLVDEL
ncbi:helix-turn-helix transcriptional regulator [Streptomyces klenkii]|uniref:helix-turn-helix domain-containing protein n=1 Tax=Streptomyces klenkii TaxID=1420899 RepID=UPI0036E3CD43